MNQIPCGQNLASYGSIQSYPNYHQFNVNSNSNNTQYNNQNNNTVFRQQPAYFHQIVYPPYDFYPYINGQYSYPFHNIAQYPQVSSPHQYNNTNQQNMSYSIVTNSQSAENINFVPSVNNYSKEYQSDCGNNNSFSSYDEAYSSDLSDDDDSFGSIFQPLSVLQEKQRKRVIVNQLLKSGNYRQQPKNNNIRRLSNTTNDNSQISQSTSDQSQSDSEMNENTNTSNIQFESQTQKSLENVSKENQDNQKVFKPKTFKEIEDEEKKIQKSPSNEIKNEFESHKFNNKPVQSRPNNRKNNSFKRGRKIW